MSRAVAGVDLGGTGTRIVISHRGHVLAEQTLSTVALATGSRAQKTSRLAAAITALVPPGISLEGLGIGASGPVDTARGIIRNPATLPGFSGFRIVAGLQQQLGVPVTIDNDAMVAAIAEQRVGAGRKAARMLLVCLGTGIGVALVLAGRPYRGLAGAHPEAGHFPINGDGAPCYCGITGCWEHLASRMALQAKLKPMVPAATAAKDIIPFAAGLRDRADIQQAFDRYGALVGRGLITLQALYMPDVIILGGSAADHFDLFKPGIDHAIGASQQFNRNIKILPTALGNIAGAIGAATIASDQQGWPTYNRIRSSIVTG